MPDEEELAIQEVVNGWLHQARSDLAVAKMVENEQIAPEILAFHAQQAAEKFLKALLIQRQIELPRTHNIGVLIHLCQQAGYPTSEIPIEAVTLSRYAVATRYPGEMDDVDRDEAFSAADLANQVAAWVNEQIFPKEE